MFCFFFLFLCLHVYKLFGEHLSRLSLCLHLFFKCGVSINNTFVSLLYVQYSIKDINYNINRNPKYVSYLFLNTYLYFNYFKILFYVKINNLFRTFKYYLKNVQYVHRIMPLIKCSIIYLVFWKHRGKN